MVGRLSLWLSCLLPPHSWVFWWWACYVAMFVALAPIAVWLALRKG
jgi:hypothetical protein